MPTDELAERFLGAAVAVLDQVAALFGATDQRTYWVFLLSSAVLAVLMVGIRRAQTPRLTTAFRRWTSASARVDYLLILAKPIIFAVFALPWALSAYGVAVGVVNGLDDLLGYRAIESLSPTQVSIVYTLVLFLAWDLSRFILHWAMHRVPVLWAFHQVHHSAEVLTPLTLYRVHPVESALYRLRFVLVTGLVTGVFFYLFRGRAVELELLGINAIGLAFNLVGANLRHTHVWWGWGRLERWFISPAQHQLHHALDAPGPHTNYGTWLAIWDRMLKTSTSSAAHGPPAFGLAPEARNHRPHSVLSALFDPLWAVAGRLRRARRDAVSPRS